MERLGALDKYAERPKGKVRAHRGVKVKRLGKFAGCVVWAVDGLLIRNEVDCDHTCGGTDGRYSYIPDREIWVEKIFAPMDRNATILHEAVERGLMIEGGLDYGDAHDRATAVEALFRENAPKKFSRRVDLRGLEAYLSEAEERRHGERRQGEGRRHPGMQVRSGPGRRRVVGRRVKSRRAA